MNSSRLEQLLEHLKEDPDDPFNIYAVAMEYRGQQPDLCLHYLNQLHRDHPDYLPTYYQLATLLEEMGEDPKVEKIYEEGIDLAKKQQNQFALRELQSAYDEFMFE